MSLSDSRLEAITSAVELAGAVLIAVGFFLFWLPAGFVVAGSELIGLSWFLAPQRGRRR